MEDCVLYGSLVFISINITGYLNKVFQSAKNYLQHKFRSGAQKARMNCLYSEAGKPVYASFPVPPAPAVSQKG
jgi:hypothetical protein